jgi:hypothetical protein
MDSRIWCHLEANSKPHAPAALTPIPSCSSARSVGSLVKTESLYMSFLKKTKKCA